MPRLRGPGEPTEWDKQFQAENERRARQLAEANRLMNVKDKEPGRSEQDIHELVWITPDIAVCPSCQHTYRRAKVGGKLSIHSAFDRDQYMRDNGLFSHAREVLAKRERERAEQQAEKDRKRGRVDLSGLVK
jgi:hypothetical protein